MMDGSRRFRGVGACALAVAAALAAVSCAARLPAARSVDGVIYGTTVQPFRQRWWHYYERGVSWSRGGFWDEAERDFRACLATRAADSRRARTYGMHFVQCFVHRELAAVLIERGRLDEAERELGISAAQEPSAKADHLLQRIADLRASTQGALAPQPAPIPAELAAAVPPSLTLQSIAVQPDVAGVPAAQVKVAGRIGGLLRSQLWAVSADNAARAVEVASDGSFTATVASGETLVAGERHDSAQSASLTVVAAPAPALTLDGPDDGRVVTGGAVYYRYQAAADSGLGAITVSEGGSELARVELSGVRGGGMLALPLTPGEHRLSFALTGSDGRSTTSERALVMVPEPVHDRRLRATALLVPLQSPIDSAAMTLDDDPRFADAVTRDGRFRLVDQRAESVITETLGLVEAGYVDPATAAKLGRKLQSRYVVTGTLRRGRGDIECFVRLIHAESGREIAAADAYAPNAGGSRDAEFFAFVAARLRQIFPVLQGPLHPGSDVARLDLGERHGVVEGMRFHVVRRGEDLIDAKTGDVLLPGEPRIESTVEARRLEARHSGCALVGGAPVHAEEQAVSE